MRRPTRPDLISTFCNFLPPLPRQPRFCRVCLFSPDVQESPEACHQPDQTRFCQEVSFGVDLTGTCVWLDTRPAPGGGPTFLLSVQSSPVKRQFYKNLKPGIVTGGCKQRAKYAFVETPERSSISIHPDFIIMKIEVWTISNFYRKKLLYL